MCASLLGELLLELARIVKDLEGAGEHPIDPTARALVEGTCADVRTQLDYPWTLSELSRRSGYSPTQLTVLFRTVTGVSPCRWLARERVERACELLTQSDQSVTQIAVEVGFGSRSQFHRVFRRLVGATPDRYRAIVGHEGQP
jgi:AraC-like DNA-binding protein